MGHARNPWAEKRIYSHRLLPNLIKVIGVTWIRCQDPYFRLRDGTSQHESAAWLCCFPVGGVLCPLEICDLFWFFSKDVASRLFQPFPYMLSGFSLQGGVSFDSGTVWGFLDKCMWPVETPASFVLSNRSHHFTHWNSCTSTPAVCPWNVPRSAMHGAGRLLTTFHLIFTQIPIFLHSPFNLHSPWVGSQCDLYFCSTFYHLTSGDLSP